MFINRCVEAALRDKKIILLYYKIPIFFVFVSQQQRKVRTTDFLDYKLRVKCVQNLFSQKDFTIFKVSKTNVYFTYFILNFYLAVTGTECVTNLD